MVGKTLTKCLKKNWRMFGRWEYDAEIDYLSHFEAKGIDVTVTVIAQLGCGYWGPNLLRNFAAQPDCQVKWVAEPSGERRAFVQSNYPEVRVTADWKDVFRDPEVSGVVIATPASTHYEMAKSALQAGKNVMIEKPLATSTDEADELSKISADLGLTLMAGDTFLYNEAVRHLKGILDRGELGELYYFYMQRLNLGQVRSDVNAWWNLAPHDISILLYLRGGEMPETVSARGFDYIQDGIEDVVFATLTWSDGVSANIHVSWLDPGKVRRVTLVGSRSMVVYDDVSEDKIVVFDKGIDKVPHLGESMDFDDSTPYKLQPRAGNVYIPKIEMREPLAVEAAHYLECIRNGTPALSGVPHARNVVAVLEAGQASLLSKSPVDVSG